MVKSFISKGLSVPHRCEKRYKLVLFITNSQDSKYDISKEISLNVEINNDLLKIFTLQELSLVQKVLENKENLEEVRIIIAVLASVRHT